MTVNSLQCHASAVVFAAAAKRPARKPEILMEMIALPAFAAHAADIAAHCARQLTRLLAGKQHRSPATTEMLG
jgi:hypothetical protein